MRILYGVQTTGRGHLVRSRVMIRRLKERGHEVRTLFSGPDVEPYWLDRTFEPWIQRRGLTHVSVGGKISYLKTAAQLRPLQLLKDIRSVRADEAELVISDYEPITVRAAKRLGIPSIGIGHLYAFSHASVPVAGANLFNREIMRRFAPADYPLGLHWHHFNHPILPPMIPDDVPDPGAASDGGPVLVYLGFESISEVLKALAEIPRQRFNFYTPVEKSETQGNVRLCPIHRERFVEDLVSAKGVICNSGFSLISEALHLGKPVLTKPVRHQTEQESNAKALKKLGLARVSPFLDAAQIRRWLDDMPEAAAMNYPDVMSAVLDCIDNRTWQDLNDLARRLWGASEAEQPASDPALL